MISVVISVPVVDPGLSVGWGIRQPGAIGFPPTMSVGRVPGVLPSTPSQLQYQTFILAPRLALTEDMESISPTAISKSRQPFWENNQTFPSQPKLTPTPLQQV